MSGKPQEERDQSRRAQPQPHKHGQSAIMENVLGIVETAMADLKDAGDEDPGADNRPS